MNYSHILSSSEQSEILEYQNCWFLGNCDKKKRSSVYNNGYDNENGDYEVILNDHLAFRYEVISILGSGSFGQVMKVWDFKTQQLKALKIIRNKQRFHKQALVEVKLLNYCLQKVCCMIFVLDLFVGSRKFFQYCSYARILYF